MNKIENLLAILGSTSAEVAENLLARGCFGQRLSTCLCPVSKYLQQYGIFWMVGDNYVRLFDQIEADVPKPVENFIREFDCYKWPALQIGD